MKSGFCIAILLIEVFLVSCSEKIVPIAPDIQSSLGAQQKIVAIHYSPAPFIAQTPEVRNAASAGTLFGAVGGAIAGAVQASEAEQAGGQLVKDYNLEDPAIAIKRTFLDSFARSSNISNILLVEEIIPTDDVGQLKRKFSQGFVFDFKTTAWSVRPVNALSPNHYRVYYAGRARLLHFPEGKTEWQGFCDAEGKIEDSAPTLLQLVANSGAVLKSQLNSASESCISQLERQLMGR